MARTVITEQEQHRRMLETPMAKLIAVMSVPTVLSQLITVVYNTADTYFVSQISTSASAAVGAAFSLQSIIQAFGYGIAMGASSLISRRLGEKKTDDANRYASSALFATVLIGLLVGVLGNLWLEPLMRALGSTETMLPHACAYARYILMGAPILCASFSLNGILRAEGLSNLAMYGLCTGGILNIALDPLFIFTLDMGTAGAAVATVISQTVSFLVLLSMFVSGKSIVRLRARSISPSLRDYWMIISTGIPTICRQGMASFASAQLNIHAAVYGDAAVAAMTIANKIYLLVRNMVIGIGQGFQPVSGYNYGAGDRGRTKKAFGWAVLYATAICAVSAVVIGARPDAFIRFFRDDPEVVRIGQTALRWACYVMPVMAYSTFVNMLYQSLGFRVEATLLALCRQGFFFLPLIWILPRIFGLAGVQCAQPGSDLLTFLISVPFQIIFFRKYLRQEEKEYRDA